MKKWGRGSQRKKMNKNFLLEIGTEEIPAPYLEPAINSLTRLLSNCLRDNLIYLGNIKSFYTPRRLSVFIEEVSPKAEDIVNMITGPPKEVSFKDGNPAPPLIGFVRAHNMQPTDVKVIQKGGKEVIAIEKIEKGCNTREILENIIPSIIKSIEFPRSMRWESTRVRFARPIRWIICLFGKHIVRFKIAGVISDRISMGLRGEKCITIDKPSNYENIMESRRIIPDPSKRMKEIERQIKVAVKKHNIEWLIDNELLKEVTNMVESPIAVIGQFDKSYLSLPQDIIRAALKGHQRYFWTQKAGKETNYFISVANNPDGDKDIIRKGNERVLNARLEDAEFYLQEDMKLLLSKRLEDLKKMLYDIKLGTLYDKTRRLTQLSLFCTSWISGVDSKTLKRAALLSKTDLTTNMIKDGKEFTKLEGIIGAEYASRQGEDNKVVNAIREQYLPKYPDDCLPHTNEGILLSLADKIDSLIGGYLVSGIPSSSKDPRAMKRNANGIVRIIIEKSISIPLHEVIRKDFKLYNRKYSSNIVNFVIQRYKQYMLDKGVKNDVVMAVHETDNILIMKMIADAIVGAGDIQEIIFAAKRINNILKGIDGIKPKVNEEYLVETEEKKLYSEIIKTEVLLDKSISKKRFSDSITLLLGLTSYINKLFDAVLIMSPDKHIKANRLSLLYHTSSLFERIADFKNLH